MEEKNNTTLDAATKKKIKDLEAKVTQLERESKKDKTSFAESVGVIGAAWAGLALIAGSYTGSEVKNINERIEALQNQAAAVQVVDSKDLQPPPLSLIDSRFVKTPAKAPAKLAPDTEIER